MFGFVDFLYYTLISNVINYCPLILFYSPFLNVVPFLKDIHLEINTLIIDL